jgi:hypothetical protein
VAGVEPACRPEASPVDWRGFLRWPFIALPQTCRNHFTPVCGCGNRTHTGQIKIWLCSHYIIPAYRFSDVTARLFPHYCGSHVFGSYPIQLAGIFPLATAASCCVWGSYPLTKPPRQKTNTLIITYQCGVVKSTCPLSDRSGDSYSLLKERGRAARLTALPFSSGGKRSFLWREERPPVSSLNLMQ